MFKILNKMTGRVRSGLGWLGCVGSDRARVRTGQILDGFFEKKLSHPVINR
jgi:hypothetical protein